MLTNGSLICIDYGEPSIKQIPNIYTRLSVPCYLLKPEESLPKNKVIGIILSGGPDHVYESNSRTLPSWIDLIDVPVLGICYGMQLIVQHLGGSVIPISSKYSFHQEYGWTEIEIISPDQLLTKISSPANFWMGHSDTIDYLPTNLEVTAKSSNGLIASITDHQKWWGIQFHPEHISADMQASELLCSSPSPEHISDFNDEMQVFQNFLQICLQQKEIN